MRLLVSWMCRAHCHRVIKLSGTLDKVAPEKELVENVHGVRSTFLDVGEEVSRRLRSPVGKDDPVFGAAASPSVYFIGKLLWSKGLGSLMELLRYAEESADLHVKVDMYGGGPDKAAAEARATKLGLDMPFLGPVDHSEIAFTHKVDMIARCISKLVILSRIFPHSPLDFLEPFNIRGAMHHFGRSTCHGKICHSSIAPIERFLRTVSQLLELHDERGVRRISLLCVDTLARAFIRGV